jgi:hypothetical protein
MDIRREDHMVEDGFRPNQARQTSLMQHRHFFGLHRKPLDDAGLALFEPSEELIGTFDAITNHPGIRDASYTLLMAGIAMPLVGVTNGQPLGGWLRLGWMFAALGILGLASCRLTGSRWVMFAITTHGLVKCRLDWLGRPRSILSRSPASVPEALQRSFGWQRIAVGDSTVWVKHPRSPVLAWMTRTYAGTPGDWSPTVPGRRVDLWTLAIALVAMVGLVGLVVGANR